MVSRDQFFHGLRLVINLPVVRRSIYLEPVDPHEGRGQAPKLLPPASNLMRKIGRLFLQHNFVKVEIPELEHEAKVLFVTVRRRVSFCIRCRSRWQLAGVAEAPDIVDDPVSPC